MKSIKTDKEVMQMALETLENELAVDMTNSAEVGEAAEQIHVVPLNDLREHVEDATCWCNPRVDDELNLVTHHSADNREAFETGERKPT